MISSIVEMWQEERAFRQERALLEEILEKRSIRTLFQPIYSSKYLAVMGYEALSRGPVGTHVEKPLQLFEAARNHGLLWDLDYLCRALAIERFKALGLKGKLFLNVDVHLGRDASMARGLTLDLVRGAGMSPSDVVIEVTERSSEGFFGEEIRRLMDHYRSQGYMVALDDIGSQHSSLNLLLAVRPDYVKVERSIVRNLHRDRFKESICRALLDIGRSNGIEVVAEGVETEEEADKLMEMGFHLFQGYYLAQPQEPPVKLNPYAEELFKRRSFAMRIAQNDPFGFPVGEIAMKDSGIPPHMTCAEVRDVFAREGYMGLVVVDEEGLPLGLVMRSRFDQMLARPYGQEIFLRRPVESIMDRHPLVVDYYAPLIEVSMMATRRDEDRIYDYVVVTRGGRYYGVVSVRRLLERTAELQRDYARNLNPLSGLPGNALIEARIRLLLESPGGSVMYVDLNGFKELNDRLGFKVGDEIISLTAEVLRDRAPELFGEDAFVGHVGGDDFVVVSRATDEPSVREASLALISALESAFRERLRPLELRCSGEEGSVPAVTVSVAALVGDFRSLRDSEELSMEVASVKMEAKRASRTPSGRVSSLSIKVLRG